jgi:putative aldouronate transport system substrate-binding protein
MIIALVAVMAACGGGNSNSGATNSGGSGGTTTSGSSGSGGNSGSSGSSGSGGGSAAPAVDVLSGPKPTLRALHPFDRFDPNKEFIAQLLEEKTGYKVEYEMLPEEMPDEKLNLLMANQEKYDYIKISKSQFFKLAEAGALMPLNDLLEQYGQNFLAGINEETWKVTTIDGVIYGIPEGSTGMNADSSLIIRKDWLEELGLEIPTTRDELYNVLKTIKEKKSGVIPLTGYGGVYKEIAQTFGIINSWIEMDGKLIYRDEHPKMKEYLAFMNKLYSEGLIDDEWPINTGSIVIEKFSSGKAAVMSLAWWSAPTLKNALLKNFPDADYVTIPYLNGDSGKPMWGVNAGITYVIAIPKWAPNKEHTMNYLNTKLNEDIFKEIVIGQEGVHHYVEDGKYYPILPIFNELYNNASYFLTGTDERVYPTYWQARVRKDPILQTYYEELQALAKDIMIPDPLSNAPPIESISQYSQTLNKFSEDTYLTYIAGAESLDTFDSFLAKWRADGGEQMVKDANEWYMKNK